MSDTGQYQLWRQDDNGHRFLVGSWPHLAEAEQHQALLTRCQHKQCYWIERVTEQRLPGSEGGGRIWLRAR